MAFFGLREASPYHHGLVVSPFRAKAFNEYNPVKTPSYYGCTYVHTYILCTAEWASICDELRGTKGANAQKRCYSCSMLDYPTVQYVRKLILLNSNQNLLEWTYKSKKYFIYMGGRGGMVGPHMIFIVNAQKKVNFLFLSSMTFYVYFF
jgi:hypothetical protein